MKMKQNLKFYLKDKLSEKELGFVPTSFDVVGSIMIFAEFPKELFKKEKLIGKTILENYHSIRTVLRKTKKYSGKFRTTKFKLISGEKKKETVHKENNVLIQLDVEKVYFSPRMGTERKRMAELVKPGESVLVMFSGCAPYPLVMAKNSGCKEVYGVEVNPAAHKYALLNIKKNKLENKIRLFCGNVTKILPRLNKKFDRLLMPLPKGGESYLEIALKYAKKKSVVHFYDFLKEEDFDVAVAKIEKACSQMKRKHEILGMHKCGEFGPGIFRVCVDFRVL
ncbi:class I SAM-dependent methyltransferase family protein [Candidatus Woesearchaeota archaeon]|nr:class I SAM-dependent methyltransferase family protein [Candidatus Woesearchaeota archaeon]MBI2661134.1 class I SAM-dependent methyltransferase family protein [Candidatus Woesearchaeota archaeon]